MTPKSPLKGADPQSCEHASEEHTPTLGSLCAVYIFLDYKWPGSVKQSLIVHLNVRANWWQQIGILPGCTAQQLPILTKVGTSPLRRRIVTSRSSDSGDFCRTKRLVRTEKEKFEDFPCSFVKQICAHGDFCFRNPLPRQLTVKSTSLLYGAVLSTPKFLSVRLTDFVAHVNNMKRITHC